MKNNLPTTKLIILFLCCISAGSILAQQHPIQYFRPWDQRGINIFEPSKDAPQPEFDSLKLRIGAAFTQNFQSLRHSNTPVYFAESPVNSVNKNLLFGAGTDADRDSTTALLQGPSTAMANLNLDVQLADGIRLSVETYMSTRHHPEFWVKGGYIQIDKLPMLGNPEWFSKYVRVKVGEFVPNYGDMHFRRSDAGNCIYNPFVENYILDAFTTEIGGEVYLFPISGLTLVAGLTNGQVHGEVRPYPETPPPGFATPNEKNPSILLKAAYDKAINEDLRFRISASSYSNAGNAMNSLYLGDRGGSHYSMVMEQERSVIYIEGVPSGIGPSTTANNKDSGRLLPLFNNKVSSLMFNGFLEFKGLEFFGTYEMAKGRMNFEPTDTEEREFTQIAGEIIYRFLPREQLYVGARYNSVTGRRLFTGSDATINRTTFAAGWFPTRNLLLKVEYVTQEYLDFTPFDYQFEGKFSGMTIQAVVGF